MIKLTIEQKELVRAVYFDPNKPMYHSLQTIKQEMLTLPLYLQNSLDASKLQRHFIHESIFALHTDPIKYAEEKCFEIIRKLK